MHRRTKEIFVVTILAAIVGAGASAGATPFHADLPASKDSFLRNSPTNPNEGADEILVVRRNGRNRAVVGFDLTGIATAGVTSARLVLSIERTRRSWGRAGRFVGVYPLLADFVEGNGLGVALSQRGTGAGVTWACASDAEIANIAPDCDPKWDGGSFAEPPTDSVLFLNSTSGEVRFDVTADVQAGDSSWLIKRSDDRGSGRVDFFSREGAALAGDPSLAPRLVIDGCSADPE